LYLDGPAEAGRVTSIVRFDPGAGFPEHGHPSGEEYYVLSGVFSDKDGDFGPGSFVFNPDGTRHAPHSPTGCEILVRLQQNPGPRSRVASHVDEIDWAPSEFEGVDHKLLYDSSAYPERVRLLRWTESGDGVICHYRGAAELFILSGALTEERERYAQGTWLRIPAGEEHRAAGPGCVAYLREHGLPRVSRDPD
jgi:quercetin dioxygenase-like cupin family protein